MLYLNNLIKINNNLNKKLWKAIFVKKISQILFTTKVVYESHSNYNITTKHELIKYTVLILKKNSLLLNKPSYLLTCWNFLNKHLFLLGKKNNVNPSELIHLWNSILKTKYKFAPLKATNIFKDIILIKKKSDVIWLKKILTGQKLKNLIKIINHKKFKLNKKYILTNKLIFNCTNFNDKLLQFAINSIIEALIVIKKKVPNQLYSFNHKNTIYNFMSNWKKIPYIIRFFNKLNVCDFFSSLTKKVVNQAFNLIIAKNDIIFYTLLKKLLNCGYVLNIANISKQIGSKKIKKKIYNQNNYNVYQGTVLSTIISNLVNMLILNDIKAVLINYNYITDINTNKLKDKIKFNIFLTKFARANVFLYFDDLLLVTYLNNKLNTELINKIVNVYSKYKLKINKTNIKTVFCYNNNNGISFLGFYLWNLNLTCWTKNYTIKSSCWLAINTIKIKNNLILLGILAPKNLPTGKRNWSANYKNLQKTKKNLKLLTNKETKYWNKLTFDFNYKTLALLPLVVLPINDILKFFYYKMINLINYYKFCDYSSYLSYFIWVLKISCFKTICAKYKIKTIKKLFLKFGANLQKLEINKNFFTKFNDLQKNIPNLSLKQKFNNNYINDYQLFFTSFINLQINTQSSKIKLECDLCYKKENNLKLHFVKNISSLKKKIKNLKFQYKNFKFLEDNSNEILKLIHLINYRKQIVICFNCYFNSYNKTLKKTLLAKLIKRN